MHTGSQKSSKHTIGTTSPNPLAEAQNFYENCYANMKYKQNAKISDTEMQNVLSTRYGDPVENFSYSLPN